MIFNFHSRGYARSLAFVSRHRLSLVTAPGLTQRSRMSATETRGKLSESRRNVEFFLLADTLMSYARSNLLRKLSFWYITILESFHKSFPRHMRTLQLRDVSQKIEIYFAIFFR